MLRGPSGGPALAEARAYRRSFFPLEEHYSFHDFFSPPVCLVSSVAGWAVGLSALTLAACQLSDTDIEAKPFVLLIGQYSVGKVTISVPMAMFRPTHAMRSLWGRHRVLHTQTRAAMFLFIHFDRAA